MNPPSLSDLGLSSEDLEMVEAQSRLFRRVELSLYGIGWVVAAFLIPSDHGLIEIAPWFFKPLYGAMASAVCIGLLRGALHLITGIELEERLIPKRTTVRRYLYLQDEYQKWKERAKREYWTSLSGLEFEHRLAELYRQIGYTATVTRASGDKGIDVWISDGHQRTPIQCKATRAPVGPGAVREFYGALTAIGETGGIFASLAGFSPGAENFLFETGLVGITLEDIVSMCDSINFTESGT